MTIPIDKRIQDLLRHEEVTTKDILAVVRDPDTNPRIGAINLGMLASGSSVFGQISCTNGQGNQRMNTGRFTKIDQFTTNGLFQGTVPDYTQNKITIPEAGRYIVLYSISFKDRKQGERWLFAPFFADVEVPDCRSWGKPGASGPAAVPDNCFGVTIFEAPAGGDFDLRTEPNSNKILEVVDAQLVIKRV